ncbi:MAG: methanogenesis marker 3 protein [Methanomicrobiaceae archaeon]|nr:methanogenesis marker 3 protein [Methanomicrobiaceae archaeon]
MITVHLDGQKKEIKKKAKLGSLIPGLPQKYSVAIIRPSKSKESATKNIRLITSAGEVVLELNPAGMAIFSEDLFKKSVADEISKKKLLVKWTDRQTVSFGTLKTSIVSDKKHHRYEKNDVILGCGGYDPENSFLIFSKMPHFADHGGDESGGVIGSIVSGRSTLERWRAKDSISSFERIISREDTSDSFTTTDRDLILEDGMEIITHVQISAKGYSQDKISTDASNSVEHMLIALKNGEFKSDMCSSGFIRDESMKKSIVPQEVKGSRLEGTVTVRTKGKLTGSLYIYTKDIPGSPNHTVTGRVVHGIELVKLISQGELISVKTTPAQIDLRGLSLKEAIEISDENGIKVDYDDDTGERIVIEQIPPNTMEILKTGIVSIKTVPLSNVIGIKLDDIKAPKTCAIFREVTGLRWYKIGMMPIIFKFEDVTLFQPKVSTKITINNENTPTEEIPANTLAMTNDSRKSTGLVGVRTSPNSEFGPTSEPFFATNVIGEIIDADKISSLKEGEIIYIRES